MAGIAVLAAAYVLSQFYRSFLAVLAPVLAIETGATKADLATASGAWFVAFALMQFVVGVGLDRYGPRATASLMLGLGAAGGAFLFAMATTSAAIIAAMVLIGAGCAPVLMAAMFVFARTHDPARFALLTSVFVGIGMAGNVLGASPLAHASQAFGWRAVMAALGTLTLVLAIAIYALVRNPERAEGTASAGFGGYLELLRVRSLWPIIPLTIVGYAVSAGIRGLWAGPFVADVYGADTIAIGQVTFWMAVAMVAGTLAYGPLDRLLNTRKWIMITGMSIVAMLAATLATADMLSLTAATVMLVGIGLFGSTFAVIMTHARAFYPAHLMGRGVTLMNFFSIGGVGVMQWITGWVVESTGGTPRETYAALFGFYAVVLAAALAVYLFSRDAKPTAISPTP